jgi:hypothetical protein
MQTHREAWEEGSSSTLAMTSETIDTPLPKITASICRAWFAPRRWTELPHRFIFPVPRSFVPSRAGEFVGIFVEPATPQLA